MKTLGEFSVVLIPLGVGGHVDHLIVRQAALRAFPDRVVRSYAEFPYARNPMKWTRKQMRGLLSTRVSVKWISRQKRAVLECYRSQMRDLFSGRPFYPEIVLSPA
jgi:LmbE family N-acetylglucosaminyl deacetylase